MITLDITNNMILVIIYILQYIRIESLLLIKLKKHNVKNKTNKRKILLKNTYTQEDAHNIQQIRYYNEF